MIRIFKEIYKSAMKIKYLILLLLLGNSIYAQQTLTLKDAIEIGLKNNFAIQIVKKTGEIAQNNFSYGNAGMLPKVDASGSYSYSNTNIDMKIAAGPQTQTITKKGNAQNTLVGSVELNWTLFDGFSMFITYEKLQSLKDKSDIEIQIAVENLIKNITSTYLEIIKFQELVEILQETINISQERLQRMKDKYEYGSALKIEVLKAELDLNTDSTNLLQTQLVLDNLKRSLAYLLGQNMEFANFNVQKQLPIYNLKPYDQLIKNAFNKNTSIMKQLKDKEISELDYRNIQSFYYPRIAFKTGYNYNRQTSESGFMLKNESNGYSFGISASINLFDGFKTSIQSQNALVNIKINELRLNDLYNQIELSINNSYQNYLKNRKIFEMQKQNLETANQNFERSKELYLLGQLTALEFREAQLNLQRAKYSLIDSEIQLKNSELELITLSGELLN